MRGKLAVLAVWAMATAGVVHAEGMNPIETRQAGQDLLAADYAGIRAVVAAKGDVKTLEDPAKAIARWIRQFPTQFPKGTEEGHNTKALPAVWSDPDGFQKAANNLAEAATKLAELAKADDSDAVAAQVKVVGEACGACHRTFRAR
jgi:cytochrome c556